MESIPSAPAGPGDLIAGKYRVEERLGAGGMGVVLRAVHTKLGKQRAIKLMRTEIAANAEATRRFLREAQAASDLHSEHVAKVFDVDQLPTGEPYMVMEYLEGADLAWILDAQGALPVDEATLYVSHACDALAEAHARGIVHRDVKPPNLFLTRRPDGSPSIKVLDFGIAKAAESSVDAPAGTGPGAFLGTLQYMSPEQMTSSRDVDARTDVWALGVVLFELLTGRLPFEGKRPAQLFALVTESAAPRPSDFTAGLPEALVALVMRCLEKAPEDRPESAIALRDALAPFLPERGRPAIDRLTLAARLRHPDVAPPDSATMSVDARSQAKEDAPTPQQAAPRDVTTRPERREPSAERSRESGDEETRAAEADEAEARASAPPPASLAEELPEKPRQLGKIAMAIALAIAGAIGVRAAWPTGQAAPSPPAAGTAAAPAASATNALPNASIPARAPTPPLASTAPATLPSTSATHGRQPVPATAGHSAATAPALAKPPDAAVKPPRPIVYDSDGNPLPD